MNRIDPDFLRNVSAAAGLHRGEQVNVNHADCPAGLDTKRRLRVWRTDNDLVTGNCMHCGLKGVTKASGPVSLRWDDVVNTPTKKLELSRYDTMRRAGDEGWSDQALAWLYKARMMLATIEAHGIRYDPQLDRVALPIFDSEGALLAMQLRGFSDSDAKYLNVYRDDVVKPIHCWITNRPDDDRIYIVEDILSAIRISKFVNVGALLGTHLSDFAKNYIAEMYTDVAVWLDPDAAGVKARSTIARDLMPIITGVLELVVTEKQPKELSDEDIAAMVAR
jgi:hypothetical protein